MRSPRRSRGTRGRARGRRVGGASPGPPPPAPRSRTRGRCCRDGARRTVASLPGRHAVAAVGQPPRAVPQALEGPVELVGYRAKPLALPVAALLGGNAKQRGLLPHESFDAREQTLLGRRGRGVAHAVLPLPIGRVDRHAGGGISGVPPRTSRKRPTTNPRAPTHIRTTPHVCRFSPDT